MAKVVARQPPTSTSISFFPTFNRVGWHASKRSEKNMEPPFLGAEQELLVGSETVIESDSPDKTRGVVFEDDGDSGYFYARDYSVSDHFFVDALHIYNSQCVTDRDKPCRVKIIWTRDFRAAALMINLVPHAVFNFAERCGYAKSPFPAPNPSTGWIHSDELLRTRALFFPQQSNTEQTDTGQPATRPESKSEGSDKPQPESEGDTRSPSPDPKG